VDGLLWLLLFGVLFFVMMRYGCGAHIAHRSHGGHPSEGDAQAGAEAPMRGRDVPPGGKETT